MPLPSNWKDWPIPAGIVAAILGAFVVGFMWVETNVVFASDLNRALTTIEVRQIERNKQQFEIKVIELKAKQQVTPEKFNGIDQVMLDEYKKNVEKAEQEIKEVKQQGVQAK